MRTPRASSFTGEAETTTHVEQLEQAVREAALALLEHTAQPAFFVRIAGVVVVAGGFRPEVTKMLSAAGK